MEAQKSAVLTKKARVENSKTVVWAKKSAEKGQKSREPALFLANPRFFGKKAWKGGSGHGEELSSSRLKFSSENEVFKRRLTLRIFLIPLTCYRLPSGLWPEIGQKWPKNGLWPHRGKGQKNGRKMAKTALNCHFSAIFGRFFPFFGHFSAPFPGEAISHFSAFFARFWAEGPKAVCSRSTRS